jgi:outer membrane immunogenic protein
MMRILLSAVAILASVGIAQAADAVVEEPQAVLDTTFVWSGGYIGLQGGYAWTEADISDFDSTADLDGGLLGLHAGYNHQWGAFVGGVEIDVEHVWNDTDVDVLGVGIDAGVNWQGSARLRAGYAIDRTLLYATGGLALAKADVESDPLGLDESETFTGWTIGAGIEHAFMENWSGRLEYRYTDFGNKEINGIDVGLEQHTVRAGISYHF